MFLTHLIPKSQKDGKNILYFTERGIQHISESRLFVCIPSTTNQFLENISGIKPKLSFRLKKKAKFTDVLSSTAGPFTDFLISSKVKEIIDSSHVMQHQFFEASIKTNDQEYEYYWLHLSQPNLVDALNYEESEFYQTEWEFLNKGPIKIKSYEHYMKLKAKDEDGSFGVSLNKIVLKENFDRSLDLFFLLPFDFNIYVSEGLKDKLESSGVTGISFSNSITF